MQGDERFDTASPDEIRRGETTDVYFKNTHQILIKKNVSRGVVAEFTASSLPSGAEWGVFAGVDELISLFEGLKIDLYSLPNGTVFLPKDIHRVNVPVAVIEGDYSRFCIYETPALGLISHASGVATRAARIKSLLMDRRLISFGARRVHPAISPFVDKYAYIGGCDAVSSIKGAELIGKMPSGTMPHALFLIMEDQKKALRAFDEVIPEDIPRIALVDTLADEKTEAILAAETLGKSLYGVRLDTHSSRRGRFEDIVAEVRWELDIRGYTDVKIAVSGGLNEKNIPLLKKAGAEIFGVGTSISNAECVEFAMDIVEVEGKPFTKRGKFAGRKEPFRCDTCFSWVCMPAQKRTIPRCPWCHTRMRRMLTRVIADGKPLVKRETPEDIRGRVIQQLARIEEINEGLRSG